MKYLLASCLLSAAAASPIAVPEVESNIAIEDSPIASLPLFPITSTVNPDSIHTSYLEWKKEQLLKDGADLQNQGVHATKPEEIDLISRDLTSVYAQGQDVGIDAPGLKAHPAYKGFPSRGSAKRQSGIIEAAVYSLLTPGLVPVGVNPVSCTPKEGQLPIILVPGTVATAYTNWAYIGPELADAGFCVYTFNHNPMQLLTSLATVQSTAFLGDIVESAIALDRFVDEVLALTGAEKVDFVGHSQGAGALPFYYLKFLMKGLKVRRAIGLAPSLGTTFHGLDGLLELFGRKIWEFDINTLVFGHGFNSAALDQQLVNSDFMKKLNENGPTVAGVEYVNIATIYDNILLPWQDCLPAERPDRNITNIILQDICAEDKSDHAALAYSRNILQIVKNQLQGTNDPVTCYAEKPVF